MAYLRQAGRNDGRGEFWFLPGQGDSSQALPVYFVDQPAWSRKRAMVRVTAAMPTIKPTIHLV